MFNKLKQFKDLRSQAKSMQDVLAQETITINKKGVKIIMNGNMEIQSIETPEGLNKNSLNNILKEAMNEAIKKTQRIMAQKMQEMGGFPGLG